MRLGNWKDFGAQEENPVWHNDDMEIELNTSCSRVVTRADGE